MPRGTRRDELFSLNITTSHANHLISPITTRSNSTWYKKRFQKLWNLFLERVWRLTVAIAVVDPLLPVLGGGHGFLEPRLFHNGAGILPGSLLESPWAFPDTAHHYHHQHQQQEKHNHPRKMLVDVKMLGWVLPGVAPLEAFDGRAWLLTPSGLHGRQQLQDVSVVGPLLVVHYLELGEGLVHALLPARWACVVRDCPFLGATWHLWSNRGRRVGFCWVDA